MTSQAAPSLISNERVLVSSGNGVLSLTNMRVIYNAKVSGASKFIGIPLDAISCSSLATRSYPILLLLSAISGLSAFSPYLIQEAAIGLGIVAIVLIAAYFATRRGVITISSGGGEHISVRTKGMKREDILSFLNSILEARHNYLLSLRGADAS